MLFLCDCFVFLKMSKWTEDTTIKFVEEYLKQDCLWNVRNTNYRNKNAKQHAFANIASVMGISNFGIKEVESKIKSIRSTYSQELKKIKDSTRSGCGTEEIYKPNIKWFDLLHDTLKSMKIEIRQTQSNLVNNEENSTDNSTDQVTEDEIRQTASTSESQFAMPNPNNSATRKRKLRDLHALVDKVRSINNSPPTTEHEFDQFAKSIASQLKAMPLLLALQAQKYIQNYLSDLRIQQLMHSERTSPYYVESPEPSPTWIGQRPQDVTTQYRTASPQSETENTVTVYSQDGDESQSILESDIVTVIVEKEN